MTTIDPRTPESGNAQPCPHAVPAAKPVNSKLAFWTSSRGVLILVGGVIALMVIFAAVVEGLAAAATRAGFDATVTSCQVTGSADLATATVGFTVTNTGNRTAAAEVSIVYRDADGSRLDTDTSYVRDVAPGDTARAHESTILDAAPNGTMSCAITGIS